MTKHTSTPVSDAVADRFDRTLPALSPDVRSVAFDALEPVDYSFPVSLCRTTSRAVPNERPGKQTLEAITVSIAALQGYVQLRSELLEHDRYTSSADRDAAILAGDYLHAFAHASIGDLSTDDAGQLELFRVLTNGSNTLARAYLDPSSGPERADLERATPTESELWANTPAVSTPDAILAGIAAELGATAVGATEAVRESIRAYGYSLSRALTVASLESPDSSAEDPRSLVIRVLSERSTDAMSAAPSNPNIGDSGEEPEGATERSRLLERELEYARTALETIEAVGKAPQTVDAVDHGDRSGGVNRAGPAPRERLERATRIPFEGVLVSNE